jgi:anion-transporting  ArsA/GET3 family ATPase
MQGKKAFKRPKNGHSGSMAKRQQKIILVTGKGGVGKSTVAASIAHGLTRKGLKVLLVEMGESSFYEDFFGLKNVGQVPLSIEPGLDVSRWNTESCLREYVLHYVKVEALYKIFFENRVMKTFIRAAPTVSEIALLGKLTSAIRNVGPALDYDRIVVDAYATGHFLALLRAPRGLSEAVRAGPIGEQTASIYKALLDPNITSYKIVSLPESLPVSETAELFSQLKSEFNVEPEIICNKIWNIPLSLHELSAMKDSKFSKYLEFIHERQDKYVPELKRMDRHLETVPLVISSSGPLDLVNSMSTHLRRL